MKIHSELPTDFEEAAECVLRKNQELYKRFGTEDEARQDPHNPDLDEVAKQAFSEVRRQYRGTLNKLAE